MALGPRASSGIVEGVLWPPPLALQWPFDHPRCSSIFPPSFYLWFIVLLLFLRDLCFSFSVFFLFPPFGTTFSPIVHFWLLCFPTRSNVTKNGKKIADSVTNKYHGEFHLIFILQNIFFVLPIAMCFRTNVICFFKQTHIYSHCRHRRWVNVRQYTRSTGLQASCVTRIFHAALP